MNNEDKDALINKVHDIINGMEYGETLLALGIDFDDVIENKINNMSIAELVALLVDLL